MPQRRNSSHNFIAIKVRKQLVDLIIRQGLTYSRAAKKLRVKLSTAKLIVRKFKETGSYFDPTTKTYQTALPPREPQQCQNPVVAPQERPSSPHQENISFPFLQPQMQFPDSCFGQVQQLPWAFFTPTYQQVEVQPPTYCWFFPSIQN